MPGSIMMGRVNFNIRYTIIIGLGFLSAQLPKHAYDGLMHGPKIKLIDDHARENRGKTAGWRLLDPRSNRRLCADDIKFCFAAFP